MTRTTWVWAILGAIYVVFFSWYTSFGGPLTDEEIDHYLAKFAENDPSRSPEQLTSLRRFMEEDTGDDFVMLNVIDMYDVPRLEGQGHGAGAAVRPAGGSSRRRRGGEPGLSPFRLRVEVEVGAAGARNPATRECSTGSCTRSPLTSPAST